MTLESEANPDAEANDDLTNHRVFIYYEDRPVEQHAGDSSKLNELGIVALVPVMFVLRSDGDVDLFAHAATQAGPVNTRYSFNVGSGGELQISTLDGDLVITYGPTAWLELTPTTEARKSMFDKRKTPKHPAFD